MRQQRRQHPAGPWLRIWPASLALLSGLLISPTLSLEPANRAEAAGGGEAERGYLLAFAGARRGRELFVGKGCVVCHTVNGVGGEVGPALDADLARPYVDPFDFAARMWRGATTMIVLQEMALGYQIKFTGGELAQIVRFLSDQGEQQEFSEDDIPESIRDWMVDDIYEQLNSDEMAQ